MQLEEIDETDIHIIVILEVELQEDVEEIDESEVMVETELLVKLEVEQVEDQEDTLGDDNIDCYFISDVVESILALIELDEDEVTDEMDDVICVGTVIGLDMDEMVEIELLEQLYELYIIEHSLNEISQ